MSLQNEEGDGDRTAPPVSSATRMTDEPLHRTLARALAEAGGSLMFGLPGGGPNLDVLGAAVDEGIEFVLAHGETEAAIMASTYGLLTGVPAPVLVTRGPGAASLANGVTQATLDRYPLISVADTVPSDQARRVAHQRVDQQAMFEPLTKHATTIGAVTTVEQLSDLISHANSWPQGAVHLDYDPSFDGPPNIPDEEESSLVVELDDAHALLASVRYPVVIVGAEAVSLADQLGPILSRAAFPILTTYQAVGFMSTEGLLHAGLFTNGALEAPVLDAADLIVTIGLDLVEPIPAEWTRTIPIIRISSVPQHDAYLPATIDIVGDVASVAAQLFERVSTSWTVESAREFRRAGRAAIRSCARSSSATGPLDPVEVVDAVADAAPPAATITVDAGAHFLAVMPLWPVERPRQLLISNGLATMGFALPAAIGAALARPGRPIVAFTGDGGMSMVLAELETVARLELPITVLVMNDAALSLIEVKQDESHGGESAVRYQNVDFAAIARASGIAGRVVKSRSELADVLDEGWTSPRLIDVKLDPTSYREILAATRGSI